MSNALCQKERAPLYLLNVVLTLAFFGYHFFLDRYYCLSADDFAGIAYASKGIPGFGYAWRFYLGWEGPFLGMIIQGLLMWLVAVGMPPFIGLLVIKGALTGSTMVLLSAISQRFGLKWSKQRAWLVAVLFNICLYLISPDKSEIWHWLIGTVVYLVPLIFLQLGTAALLKNKFWWAIAALAFVMQSRATYAVLGFGFIVLLTMLFWWKKAENRKQWLLLSAFLLLFLALYLIAPGNYVRLKEHGNAFPFLITQFKIGLQNLFVSYNIAKMDRVLLALLAVLPWVGFQGNIPRPKQVWQWGTPAVLYVGFAIAHEALFVYITGWREWTRVLSLHSFLFLSMVVVYGFWVFSFVSVSWKKYMQAASLIGVVGLFFHLFIGFGNELQMGKEFKTSYDARMISILEHKSIGDTLYIEPINYNGILYFEDFSEDPNHWINKDFAKAYKLDFKVALKQQDDQ